MEASSNTRFIDHKLRLAAESALIDPILRQNQVIPENLRFEPIDLLAIQASVDWGDTAHDYPWESVPKTGNRNPFSEIALAERLELDTLARLAS